MNNILNGVRKAASDRIGIRELRVNVGPRVEPEGEPAPKKQKVAEKSSESQGADQKVKADPSNLSTQSKKRVDQNVDMSEQPPRKKKKLSENVKSNFTPRVTRSRAKK